MRDLIYRLTDWARQQISTKVQASTAGGIAGVGVVTPLVLWLLGGLFWGGDLSSAGAWEECVAAVPAPVSAAVGAALVGLLSFVSGYRTTERADLDAQN